MHLMSHNLDREPLSPELQELTAFYGTNSGVIRRLIKGGVREEDLFDVLGLRESLFRPWVSSDYGDRHPRRGTMVGHDIVSANALAAAYRAVGGDMDLLSQLTDVAIERISGRPLIAGVCTRTFNGVVSEWRDLQRNGLGRFEESDADDSEEPGTIKRGPATPVT